MTKCGLFLLFGLFVTTLQQDLKGFDDSILFDINWAGDQLTDFPEDDTSEFLIATSSHQEKYKCILPNIQENENSIQDKYVGPSGVEIISALFSQSFCSYRLESYWTYEICHGKKIRQYHEDREGKKIKLQEYTLGKWDEGTFTRLAGSLKAIEESNQIPVKKIDNVNLPYVEVLMGNGTLCDLTNNQPRETKVLYVCYQHGKHDVYSLKETSTCQYEIVILSPLLCAHPKYKPKEYGDNKINCIPLDKSPKKPHNLAKLNLQSQKLRRKSDFDSIRVEFVPIDLTEKDTSPAVKVKDPVVSDTSPVESFLSGRNCLVGGTGWWKYEFCYGQSVEQYHVEKDGSRTSINLGKFDKAKHLEWLQDHPHKRPKPLSKRTQLSHFYSGGTTCDKTGKPRQTEVKLKCLENSANINSVSLYLLEPKYCEYVLGVESPLICDILSRADDDGMVPKLSLEGDVPEVNIVY